MAGMKCKNCGKKDKEIAKLHTYGDTYKKDYHDMKDERDELKKYIPHIKCLKRCDDNKCDCIKDFIDEIESTQGER